MAAPGRDRWHGFVQNLRRGHYELAVEQPVSQRVAVAFDELALAI
jgi:transposase, IS6 family